MRLLLLPLLVSTLILSVIAGSFAARKDEGNRQLLVESLPVPAPTSATFIKIDQYSNISLREERLRWQNFAAKLKRKEFEAATAYIISYPGRRAGRYDFLKKSAEIKNYLVKTQKIDSNRIFIIKANLQKDFQTVELFIVPPGASAPVPD